jgi:hypothetical protein
MFDGPTTDAGAVGVEIEATVEFAGGAAVGGRWFGGEQFGEQGGDFGSPLRVMIATGETGRPGFGVALSAGEQVGGAQLIEAAHTDAQFERDRLGREQAGTGLCEEMADQWRGYAMSQLVSELIFFIAAR